MRPICKPDDFYNRMSLVVEGEQPREVTELPFSNCNTYQEFLEFDDFKAEVIDKGNTIDKKHKTTFEDVANTFHGIIKGANNVDENDIHFKITNSIILLVGREIQNSTSLISITNEKEKKSSGVLLDKINNIDRFKGLEDKVQVSKELITMLQTQVFSGIPSLTPEQMLSILMAFFISDSLIKQYRTIFVDDDNNTYSTIFAEISPDKLGNTNFTYIEKNKTLISDLFKVKPERLGTSTYEVVISSSGEIEIVKTLFYFLFLQNLNLGDDKILLAMIHTKITYFLASNSKTIEDEFRWILCEHTLNLIQRNDPTIWFIKCLSLNPGLKWLSELETKEISVKEHQKNVHLQEKTVLKHQTALNTLRSDSPDKVKDIEAAEKTLESSTNYLKEKREDLEKAKTEPFKLSSAITNNPGKTALVGTSLAAAAYLAMTLGGNQTKKLTRKKKHRKRRSTRRKTRVNKKRRLLTTKKNRDYIYIKK